MLDLTMRQALGIWEELLDAYNGLNGYGGNVAEIYAYRLQQRDPTAELATGGTLKEAAIYERAKVAAHNMRELLGLFLEIHQDCTAMIDGVPWLDALDGGLEHRCHILIQRRKQ